MKQGGFTNRPLLDAARDAGYVASDGALLKTANDAITRGEWRTTHNPSADCYIVKLGDLEPTASNSDVDNDARFVDVPVSISLNDLGRAYASHDDTYDDWVGIVGKYMARFAPDDMQQVRLRDVMATPVITARLFTSKSGGYFHLAQIPSPGTFSRCNHPKSIDAFAACEASIVRELGVTEELPYGPAARRGS